MKRERNDLAAAILDAIPSLVFMVDKDVQVLEANRSALNFLARPQDKITGRRGGTILGCINAVQAGNCGEGEACRRCVLRETVAKAFKGKETERAKVKVQRHGDLPPLFFMVSATPFPNEGKNTVILALEDITELMYLRNILPICCHCRKVRDDEGYWNQIEEYFAKFHDALFSHGICPHCLEIHYPGVLKDIRHGRT